MEEFPRVKENSTAAKFWPWLRRGLRWYAEHGSPRNWLEWFRSCAGCYLSFRFMLLLGSLSLVVHFPDNQVVICGACLFASLVILDILLKNTAVAFVTRYPADPLRTVVLQCSHFYRLRSALPFSTLPRVKTSSSMCQAVRLLGSMKYQQSTTAW